jgi:hypothetical protein
MLRGKNKIDTAENISILIILVGALMLSGGIALSGFNSQGFSALLAMGGAVTTFLFTAILIFVWLAKEFFGD